MTLLDDILPVAYSARGIAGALGFRPYTLYLCTEFYQGAARTGPDLVPLVEGNGQPPKWKQVKYQDLAVGAIPPDIGDIGPITPAFPGGGTDLSEWLAAVEEGQVRHILKVGPECPDGKKYRILSISTDRALRYMIRAQSEAEALQGYGGAI